MRQSEYVYRLNPVFFACLQYRFSQIAHNGCYVKWCCCAALGLYISGWTDKPGAFNPPCRPYRRCQTGRRVRVVVVGGCGRSPERVPLGAPFVCTCRRSMREKKSPGYVPTTTPSPPYNRAPLLSRRAGASFPAASPQPRALGRCVGTSRGGAY
jgi:hypothetical protein